MKFTIRIKELREAINKASKIASKNATLPVLSCLILNAGKDSVLVQATNLDVGISITLRAKVENEGIVAIPADVINSFVTNLSEEENITITQEDEQIHVLGQKVKTSIKIQSHDDFPSIPFLEADQTFTINSQDLIKGLKSVWYSASNSTMKPELSSVYIYSDGNYLVFVATDSFRLAEKRVRVQKADQCENILIPHRNVSEIIRIFDNSDVDIEVRFDKNQISFSEDGTYLLSRTVDGVFPDYKQIIPKTSSTDVTLLKQDIINALKVSTIFTDKFNQITMGIDSEMKKVSIQSKNVDRGENSNEVDAVIRGESISANFNQRYITDCFNSVLSDSLVFQFDGIGKPMIIKGVDDQTFMYLVMPMNKQ